MGAFDRVVDAGDVLVFGGFGATWHGWLLSSVGLRMGIVAHLG